VIIVQLTGGLGNQLFQYAAGRYLSFIRQTELKLDLSWYAQTTENRPYALNHFRIEAATATETEIAQLRHTGLRRLWTRWQERSLPYYRKTMYYEPSFAYDENFSQAKDNVYLLGYRQSEKYFLPVADLIRRELQLKEKPQGLNATLAKEIIHQNSVSLHVRRGDYLSNPVFARNHPLCSLHYYQRCISLLAQTVSDPHFFIFSDDPEWAQEHLQLEFPHTFVTHNGDAKNYEDLHLMSLCKHHILANSSFSWWGAWLRPSDTKLVYAPSRWFSTPERDTRDLLPSSWIQVES